MNLVPRCVKILSFFCGCEQRPERYEKPRMFIVIVIYVIVTTLKVYSKAKTEDNSLYGILKERKNNLLSTLLRSYNKYGSKYLLY